MIQNCMLLFIMAHSCVARQLRGRTNSRPQHFQSFLVTSPIPLLCKLRRKAAPSSKVIAHSFPSSRGASNHHVSTPQWYCDPRTTSSYVLSQVSPYQQVWVDRSSVQKSQFAIASDTLHPLRLPPQAAHPSLGSDSQSDPPADCPRSASSASSPI